MPLIGLNLDGFCFASRCLKTCCAWQVMITGDQALTACHVASHVNIVTRPVLVLTQRSDDSVGQFDWISPDETHKLAYKYGQLLFSCSFLFNPFC